MAERYEIEPVKNNVLTRKVSSFWSWVIIIIAAATVVLIARYVLDAALESISYTYGPVQATPISEDYFDYEINEREGESFITVTGYHGDLREVNIPDEIDGLRVREIARFAFMSNEVIYTVRVPEGVSFIGNMCFFNCPKLKNVYIPESASEIGGWCFGKTENITVEGINGSEAQKYCEQRNIYFVGYSPDYMK